MADITGDLTDIDWAAVKADLRVDDFDNGRSPQALEASFRNSAHVAVARHDGGVVGTARMLSDGVCNAYVVDVWTRSDHRRQGIATAMMASLVAAVPGQHIGLQVDPGAAEALYRSIGFDDQPSFLSLVVGRWLDNAANRR